MDRLIAEFCSRFPEEAERIAFNLPDEYRLPILFFCRKDVAEMVKAISWQATNPGPGTQKPK